MSELPNYDDTTALRLARECARWAAEAVEANSASLVACEQTTALREQMLAAMGAGDDAAAADLMQQWVAALGESVTQNTRCTELSRLVGVLLPLVDRANRELQFYIDTIEHPERIN